MGNNLFEEMVENWPKPVVWRSEVFDFSFGMVSKKTLANEDHRGRGPMKQVFGKHVAYLPNDLAEWLREKYGSEEDDGRGRIVGYDKTRGEILYFEKVEDVPENIFYAYDRISGSIVKSRVLQLREEIEHAIIEEFG